MPAPSLSSLRAKIESLENIPSAPAILIPVLRQLEAPSESVDMQKIIDLVGHDKSITAQVLRMANSPLFGQRQRVTSVRGAVMNLGLQRMREIVVSCSLLKLAPPAGCSIDPTALWEHSLGCALVCRKLSRRLQYNYPERAYLAGLLHDIGILVNILVIPNEYREVLQIAIRTRNPLDQVEREHLGFTHATTGEFLGTTWRLIEYLNEAIRRHHEPETATLDPELCALVCVADTLCRISGLGHGYTEMRAVDIFEMPAWEVLARNNAQAASVDMARFSFELETYVKEVRALVTALFRIQ